MCRLLASVILFFSLTGASSAQQYYIGEILGVGFNFCPQGTLTADGSVYAASQYQALYALYGGMYGGNGTTTFGVPNITLHTPSGQALRTCVVYNGIYPPRP